MAAAVRKRTCASTRGGIGARRTRVRRLTRFLVLLGTDVLAGAVAVAAVVGLRGWVRGPTGAPEGIWVAVAAWILLRVAAGLYTATGLSGPEELRISTSTTMLGGLLYLTALFGLQVRESRFVAVSVWVLLAGLAWALRGASKRALISLGMYGEPAVVVGSGPAIHDLVRELRNAPEVGLRPVAVFCDDYPRGHEVEGVPVRGPVASAADASDRDVDHAVIALAERDVAQAMQAPRALLENYRVLVYVPGAFVPAQLWLQPQPVGRYLMLRVQNNLLDPTKGMLKRALDLLLGIPLLVLSTPVIAVCALAVALADGRPCFFVQEREGQHGRRLRVWKIRTMVRDAEERLDRLLQMDEAARAEWEQYVKLRRDPRVIPLVGRALRRLSLDELPQLWNVVCGDMSLVGPRPFTDYHLAKFPEEFRALRRLVRPGITGLWQVTTRADGDLGWQMEADAYYVRNWSLWLDLWILLRTPGAVLRGRGAY